MEKQAAAAADFEYVPVADVAIVIVVFEVAMVVALVVVVALDALVTLMSDFPTSR